MKSYELFVLFALWVTLSALIGSSCSYYGASTTVAAVIGGVNGLAMYTLHNLVIYWRK